MTTTPTHCDTAVIHVEYRHLCSFTAVCSKNICAAHTNFASVFLYQMHENRKLQSILLNFKSLFC